MINDTNRVGRQLRAVNSTNIQIRRLALQAWTTKVIVMCAYLFFWTNFPHRQTSESDIIIRWLKFPRSSFIFFKRRLYSDHYEIASKTPVLEHCCIVFHRAYALLVYHKYVLHAEKCKLLSCHQENSSYKSAILYMITTQHSKWYSFLAGGYSLALELTKDCLN